MRIRVIDILDLFAAGLNAEQILEEMPDLNAEDLQAALQYAAPAGPSGARGMIVWIDAQFSPAERDRFSCIPKAVQRFNWLCLKSHLEQFSPAMPPDVRRGSAAPSEFQRAVGLAPGPASGLCKCGKARTGGTAPLSDFQLNGAA
jgi:hypothetical protein